MLREPCTGFFLFTFSGTNSYTYRCVWFPFLSMDRFAYIIALYRFCFVYRGHVRATVRSKLQGEAKKKGEGKEKIYGKEKGGKKSFTTKVSCSWISIQRDFALALSFLSAAIEIVFPIADGKTKTIHASSECNQRRKINDTVDELISNTLLFSPCIATVYHLFQLWNCSRLAIPLHDSTTARTVFHVVKILILSYGLI